jgi:hypothetical protein
MPSPTNTAIFRRLFIRGLTVPDPPAKINHEPVDFACRFIKRSTFPRENQKQYTGMSPDYSRAKFGPDRRLVAPSCDARSEAVSADRNPHS